MKRTVIVSVILTVFILTVSALTALANPAPKSYRKPDLGEKQSSSAAGNTHSAHESISALDRNITVSVLTGGSIEHLTMHEYLIGVLAAEMPLSFDGQALMAQAVAARTYTLFRMLVEPSEAHPDANVCDDYTCCKAYTPLSKLHTDWGSSFSEYYEKANAAVESTDGQCLIYGGEPILAAFHSCSVGATESCADVWGGDYPYLKSVYSPESADAVPEYIRTVTLSPEDFKAIVTLSYPSVQFPDMPENWISDAVYLKSGRLGSVCIGDISLTGTQVREMFGLRSAAIEFSADSLSVTLTTYGSGHGVGMSQYGAELFAQQGYSYSDILLWYYSGAMLASTETVWQ